MILIGAESHQKYLNLFEKISKKEIIIKRFNRLGELVFINNTLGEKTLKDGDAIICFSRKSVIETYEELKRKKYSVSMIYGAMNPEVRKNESKKFRDKETTILVATDAIGMGINLPIDRVLFSDITKFDGKVKRDLNCTEIKQIGGRAGRGKSAGIISFYKIKPNRSQLRKFQDNLNSNIQVPASFFYYYPSWNDIDIKAKELKTTSILKCFNTISSLVICFLFSCVFSFMLFILISFYKHQLQVPARLVINVF
jgi:superfamily II DNA/RNA helicase